jgi:hypothetical protein
MSVRRLIALSAAALISSTTALYAGPCATEIDRAMALINAKLGGLARTGPSAPQTPGAGLHRQPTPRSVAGAESKLGGLSAATMEAVEAAMDRAREADRVGNQSACDQALADAQRLIGP